METTTTRQLYFCKEENRYIEERNELHKHIIQQIIYQTINDLNIIVNNADKEIIFIGGGSGSGKTTALRDIINGLEDYIKVDADIIKNFLPEYYNSNHENKAYLVHDESSDISLKLLEECRRKAYNIVYDGTMKNLTKYLKLFAEYKKDHYKIQILFVDCAVEEAFVRAIYRSRHGEHRIVPLDIIRTSNYLAAQSLYKIINDYLHLVDEIALMNFSSNEPTKVFYYSFENNTREIYDQLLYNEFKLKATLSDDEWLTPGELLDILKKKEAKQNESTQYNDHN